MDTSINNRSSLSSSSSPSCDRRLSRAARESVLEQLGPILLRFRSSSSATSITTNNDKATRAESSHSAPSLHQLERLLQDFIISGSSATNNSTSDQRINPTSQCPLSTLLDVHWQDEINSWSLPPSKVLQDAHIFAGRSPSVINWGIPRYAAWRVNLFSDERNNNNNNNPGDQNQQNWFQCGYCGKVFCTRYYLDQHLTRQHSTIESSQAPKHHSSSSFFCPAVDWCQTVVVGGLATCSQVALHNEPYYDRGSGGLIQGDRLLVYHQLRLQAHAMTNSWCSISMSQNSSSNNNVAELDKMQQQQYYQQACGRVMDQCFEPQLAQVLQTEICTRLFQCRHHHHRSLLLHWKEEWDYYYNSGHTSHSLWWLFLSLVLLTTIVVWAFWFGNSRRRHSGTRAAANNMYPKSPGTRLLRPLAASTKNQRHRQPHSLSSFILSWWQPSHHRPQPPYFLPKKKKQ